MSPTTVVVFVHVAATWFMVGLIWTIQVVHYPLFAAVGRPSFPAYEADHTRRMGLLLAVPWGFETVSAVWLVVAAPADVPWALPAVGLALSAAVVLVTVVVAVPAHQRLAEGYVAAAHRRLVRSNWVRTVAWSARGGVALAIVYLAELP